MSPLLTLRGKKIRLRPLLDDDAKTLVNAASDGELWNLSELLSI
jgi:hypothetical protein